MKVKAVSGPEPFEQNAACQESKPCQYQLQHCCHCRLYQGSWLLTDPAALLGHNHNRIEITVGSRQCSQDKQLQRPAHEQAPHRPR